MSEQPSIEDIVKSFLLNAPPGEFMEVVSDVRVLLKNDDLLNSLAPSTFREYNESQLIKVDSPKGHKFLISKYGSVGTNEYLDPVGGIVVNYDHIKQEVTGSRAIQNELDAEVEPYRKAFEAAAKKYQEEHYEHGAQVTYGKKNGGSFEITTCISSSLFNHRNYWGGRWRSVWTFKFTPGSGNAQVDGNIRIQVHYYEEGNVQLNTNTSKSTSIPSGDAQSLAESAFKAVEKLESDFQGSLEKNYNTMGSTTFKALRRALPITRQKIDWDKILQHKMTQEFSR